MRFIISCLMLTVVSISSPAAAKLKTVASFSILADIVSEIAGEDADVSSIVGPDADAHLYMPTAADAIAVTQADVVFVNGLGFETWSDKLIETSGTKAAIITVTDEVTPVMVDGEIDPHAWNALGNGVKYAQAVMAALSQYDRANAAAYQARGEAYIAKLKALDAKTRKAIDGLPADNRIVVTAHDAFGYLADAYGLTFLAPVGIDTSAEPSAKDMADLISYLNEVGAGALFVENISNDALIAQISAETGLEIGGRLYSDALSVKGSPATSYVAMFEHNLGSLITALSR